MRGKVDRQKEIDLYAKKAPGATLRPLYSLLQVKTLFQGLDSTGDGAINLEEFSKLVKSDKLAFWMSQLELEYHDLLQLFEPLGALKGEGNPPVRFLDNGDGQAGAFRVPGSLNDLLLVEFLKT